MQEGRRPDEARLLVLPDCLIQGCKSKSYHTTDKRTDQKGEVSTQTELLRLALKILSTKCCKIY